MKTKVTVEKRLVLEFELPGYSGGAQMCRTAPNGFHGESPPTQLQHELAAETWRIEVNLDTAADTLRVLRELAAAIEQMII